MVLWRSDREEVRAKPCVWIKSHGWVVGLLTGLLFLGIGLLQGQLALIWRKAAMICMECIGIG